MVDDLAPSRDTHPNQKVEAQLDIQGRLKMYFPILFELLGKNSLNWKTIDKVFQRKLRAWHSKYDKEKKAIRVEASFYNIITASIEGNTQAKSFLDFLQKLFESLLLRLNENERKLTVPALYGMLTNINSMYLNFVGELCVLNNVKLYTNLLLTAVEVPVLAAEPKGKKIDFDFLNPETGNHLLVEIVNVHLNSEEELTDETINRLLHQKIQGKLNITGILKTNTFQLIPVFWGPFDSLKQINTIRRTIFNFRTRANRQALLLLRMSIIRRCMFLVHSIPLSN